MKRSCRECSKKQDVDKFPSAGIIKGKKYYRYLCVQCYSKTKKSRRHKIRAEYFEIKKGLSCEVCGNDDYRVLEFDHLDHTQKSFTISEAVSKAKSLDKIKAEIDKCQVLCANCHRIKTWEERNGSVV